MRHFARCFHRQTVVQVESILAFKACAWIVSECPRWVASCRS